ncbi:lycopene cyclase domain-containing protein [Thermogemmatispora onikobensis]|uniref:lycopene cyclase domain-containing protein n=1 Tax=Thermogemmatispora onikobensis TaxID=732234 RepID=UPI00085336C3|nr:lycopene cyclase domain-containing protein [Thermogemmatispora onikobensis]
MTYAGFLALFLLAPCALLALLLRRRLLCRRYYWLVTALLGGIVLLAMAPWDHAAVARGIWNWSPTQTWGLRLWLIPLEEYLFALLETLLTTLLLFALLPPDPGPGPRRRVPGRKVPQREPANNKKGA